MPQLRSSRASLRLIQPVFHFLHSPLSQHFFFVFHSLSTSTVHRSEMAQPPPSSAVPHMPASAAATVPLSPGQLLNAAAPAPPPEKWPVQPHQSGCQKRSLSNSSSSFVRGHASVPPPATSGKRSRQWATQSEMLLAERSRS